MKTTLISSFIALGLMADPASAESVEITRIYGYRCLVPVDAETARYKYFANLDAEGVPSSVPCEPLYTAEAAEAAQEDSPDAIWPDTPDSRYITHMEQALFNFCIVAYTKGYRAGGGTDEVELMNNALAACDASQNAGLAESADQTTEIPSIGEARVYGYRCTRPDGYFEFFLSAEDMEAQRDPASTDCTSLTSEPVPEIWHEIQKSKPASESVACLCRDLEGQYRVSWVKEFPEKATVPAGYEFEWRAFR